MASFRKRTIDRGPVMRSCKYKCFLPNQLHCIAPSSSLSLKRMPNLVVRVCASFLSRQPSSLNKVKVASISGTLAWYKRTTKELLFSLDRWRKRRQDQSASLVLSGWNHGSSPFSTRTDRELREVSREIHKLSWNNHGTNPFAFRQS